jgi:uncharacterized membrane protein YkgB
VSSCRSTFASHAEKLGGFILRYGLVAILLYFGAYKFTAEEAQGIAPLVAHSPLFNWLQALLGTQGIDAHLLANAGKMPESTDDVAPDGGDVLIFPL